MKLAPAIQKDIESFSKIEFENMGKFLNSNPEWSIGFVRKTIAKNLQRCWKLVDDSILGFYYWTPDEDCAVLLSIQVCENQRSKGYGSKLLDHFHKEAGKN